MKRGSSNYASTGAQDAWLYLLLVALGCCAFFYPFILSVGSPWLGSNRLVAPFIGAGLAVGVVGAVALESARRRVSGTTVAMLGILSAVVGVLRFFDLPLGGNAMFFFLVLVGVAFGARFGMLLGLVGMAVSGLVTGGLGPWLPFQMIAASWLGASAGLLGRFTKALPQRLELCVVVGFGWLWGFVYGALMNLTSWPFGVSMGPLSWQPGSGLMDSFAQYWRFYVATSLAWDAAGATATAVLLALCGVPTLVALRRVAPRLSPAVRFKGALPKITSNEDHVSNVHQEPSI